MGAALLPLAACKAKDTAAVTSENVAKVANSANVEFVAMHQKEIAAVSALNSASGSSDEH